MIFRENEFSSNYKVSFETIRKNAPDNWTKIGYTFGRRLYGWQFFCVKILMTTGGDSSLLDTFQWRDIEYLYREWRQSYLSLRAF